MSNPIHRTHRSPHQWQQLLDQWASSGVSAAKFCTQHQLAYSTFQAWRNRLKDQSRATVENSSTEPNFIDLSQLSTDQSERWRITLRLGNGVELELSQD